MGKENSNPKQLLTLQVERINEEFRKLENLQAEIRTVAIPARITITYKREVYSFAEDALKYYSALNHPIDKMIKNVTLCTRYWFSIDCSLFDLSESSELIKSRHAEMGTADFKIWKSQYLNELGYKLSRVSAFIVGDIIQVLNSETGYEFCIESIRKSYLDVSKTYDICGNLTARINFK